MLVFDGARWWRLNSFELEVYGEGEGMLIGGWGGV